MGAASAAQRRIGHNLRHLHKAIHAATLRLGEVARTAKNESVARLAEDLKAHAQSEEDVFYPAAILVGDIVRMHLHTGVAPN